MVTLQLNITLLPRGFLYINMYFLRGERNSKRWLDV
jgi:hypothetical protein